MPATLPNILLVDDSPTNILYLEIILRSIQANLIKAYSGAEALELVRNVDLSLAILDVQMPQMNGYDLAIRLNEERADNKVPIIFLTANYPENAQVLEGYRVGAVDYIIKPMNEVILTSKIKVFLELYWQKQHVLENSRKLEASEQELRQAKQQLEQMNDYLIKAIEEERNTLAMQVHDELGQAMTAFKMDLSWLKHHLDEQDAAWQRIDQMVNLTNDVIHKIQRIASELHPVVLDDLGLVSAIEWYCHEFTNRTAIPCELNLEEIDASPQVNLALFRVLQEAMTNVIRHAQATRISIELKASPAIRLTVSDNGTGITGEASSSNKSFGIITMKQRISQCGGQLTLTGKSGEGTCVEAVIPSNLISDSHENTHC